MNFVRKKDKVTKAEEAEALRELSRLVSWVSKLKETEAFSREWVLYVLEEITLQCMGKRKISIHGIPMQLFDAKNALKAAKLGAEVQGFLNFANRSLTLIPKSANDEPKEPVSASLQTDADRTKAVYSILAQSGVFPEQQSKELDITDVEVLE
jgi:hypothetical protein